MRRYTRLSNGFSRKIENHMAAVAINYFAYNFIVIHRTLRTSPAMAAGVTDRLFDVMDDGAGAPLQLSGLGLMFAGITIRWTAVHALGVFFTGRVQIREGHTLIRTGLLRDPAAADHVIVVIEDHRLARRDRDLRHVEADAGAAGGR